MKKRLAWAILWTPLVALCAILGFSFYNTWHANRTVALVVLGVAVGSVSAMLALIWAAHQVFDESTDNEG